MGSNVLEVSAALVNDKVKFECSAAGRDPVIVDYVPPVGGGEGFTSLELLLASLASCIGTTVKVLTENRLKKKVENLRVTAKGRRRETHPTYLEKIDIGIEITCAGLSVEDAGRMIHYGRENICPVINMLGSNVCVEITHSVKEPQVVKA